MSNVREIGESVTVFVLRGSVGPDEFSAYLRELDAALAAGQPFAMVVDGTDGELALAVQPNKRWQLSRAIAIGQLHRGIAFVTGPMTRERVQVLTALQPASVPYAFFSEQGEALEWARAMLDGEGKGMLDQRKTVPLMTIAR